MDILTVDTSIKEIEHFILLARKRIMRYPDGNIRVKHNYGRVEFRIKYYDENNKRTEKYLKKDDKRTIANLSGKRYCEKLIPVLEKELAALNEFKNKYHPHEKYEAYETLPVELKQYVSPIAKTVRQIAEEWQEETFQNNEYEFDLNRTYTTSKGERVRSRAEYIIANMLYDAGIPYRYECRLELQSGKTVYPDFTVMHPQSGEFYYIEFFGMMDDLDYAEGNWEKIRKYSCDPVFSHLYMFFDTAAAPFDTMEITNLINTVFL